MASPKPERKRQPEGLEPSKVLSMQLRIGDRVTLKSARGRTRSRAGKLRTSESSESIPRPRWSTFGVCTSASR